MKKDIISKIESLLEKGYSIRSISKELGVSRNKIFKKFPELYNSAMSEENQKCLISDYLKAKLKIEELEEKYNTSRSTIYKILYSKGCKRSNYEYVPKFEDQDMEIRRLHSEGLSKRKISEVLEITRYRVNLELPETYESTLTEDIKAKIIQDYMEEKYTKKELMEIYSVSYHQINYLLNKVGKLGEKYSTYQKEYNIGNEDIFEEIDNEDSAYLLGFFVADGYIDNSSNRIGFELSKKDIKHLEKIKHILKTDYKIRSRSNRDTSILRVSSKKIIHDLNRLGITGNKTYNQKSLLHKIPYELRRHFVRGVWDGDGGVSIPKEKNSCLVYLYGKYEVVLDFVEYFKINRKRIRPRNTNHGIVLGGNRQCFKILNELYRGANIFLDRKYNIYANHFYIQPIINS